MKHPVSKYLGSKNWHKHAICQYGMNFEYQTDSYHFWADLLCKWLFLRYGWRPWILILNIVFSPVHVVLVSLLVDQLSGLFLIFFGRPKKNLSSIRSFLFTLLNFLSSLFWKCGFGQSLGRPIVRSISHFLKKTGQKIQESEQKRSETGQIFFWSTKKNEK